MNKYYEDILDPNNFYQGDILINYDVIILPTGTQTTLHPSQGTSAQSDLNPNGTVQVFVKRLTINVLIISHSCDIQHRDFIAICPIFPISKIDSENKKEDIRKGKNNYRFWLPEKTGELDESYADLQIINTITASDLSIDKRILSLTDRYRSNLTDCIYRYFCRPIKMQD